MVTIEGDVFATDHLEMKKRAPGSSALTSRTAPIPSRVAKFMVGDEGKAGRGIQGGSPDRQGG